MICTLCAKSSVTAGGLSGGANISTNGGTLSKIVVQQELTALRGSKQAKKRLTHPSLLQPFKDVWLHNAMSSL